MQSDLIARQYKELAEQASDEVRPDNGEFLNPHGWVRTLAGLLDEDGAAEEISPVYYESGYYGTIHGYGLRSDGCDLVYFHFCGDSGDHVSESAVREAFAKLGNFKQSAVSGILTPEMLPSPELGDLVATLRRQSEDPAWLVRLVFISNGLVDEGISERVESANMQVYDLRYFAGATDPASRNVHIDLTQHGTTGLSFIEAPLSGADYSSVLVAIPAPVLCSLYEKYGDRLMEANVRSFLQAKGKVNRGMLDTLRNSPTRFFAYNNGISATSEGLDIKENDGVRIITGLTDLQIVNGGQTTASIYHASKRLKIDVSNCVVQAKITVVPDHERLNEIVPIISRCANTQNKVSAVDFYANAQWHVDVEKLSRDIVEPVRSSYWYYERMRGQFVNERAKSGSRTRVFEQSFPKSQVITKPDVAKVLNAWDKQRPNEVCLGAEKNFKKYFADRSDSSDASPVTPDFFKELVSKIILFRSLDAMISKIPDWRSAYKAQVAAYTMSWVAANADDSVDFEQIWAQQKISDELSKILMRVFGVVRKSILEGNQSIRNITEWCKKEACWEVVRQLQIPLDDLSSGDSTSAVGSSVGDSDSAREEKWTRLDKQKWHSLICVVLAENGPANECLLIDFLAERLKVGRKSKKFMDRVGKFLKSAVKEEKIEVYVDDNNSDFSLFALPGQGIVVRERSDWEAAYLTPVEIVEAYLKLRTLTGRTAVEFEDFFRNRFKIGRMTDSWRALYEGAVERLNKKNRMS